MGSGWVSAARDSVPLTLYDIKTGFYGLCLHAAARLLTTMAYLQLFHIVWEVKELFLIVFFLLRFGSVTNWVYLAEILVFISPFWIVFFSLLMYCIS